VCLTAFGSISSFGLFRFIQVERGFLFSGMVPKSATQIASSVGDHAGALLGLMGNIAYAE